MYEILGNVLLPAELTLTGRLLTGGGELISSRYINFESIFFIIIGVNSKITFRFSYWIWLVIL